MSSKINVSQLSTPNIRASEAILLLAAETAIDAPAGVVFQALRNTDTWRDWNRFVPKVTINYQPPDTEAATAAEIQELVRNTSISGSFYSDLTDGGIGAARQRSPDEQPPPRFRLSSASSRGSQGDGFRRSADGSILGNRGSVSSVTSNGKSGAQLFQETTQARKDSAASGEEPEPIANRIETSNVHRASVAIPSPNSPGRKGSKQKYTQVVGMTPKSLERAHHAMMSIYGEPSVRLQVRTKLTFHVRMKPTSPSDYTDTNIIVTEVSRPDDPVAEKGMTDLTRPKTHTLDREGIFRVVWANDTDNTSILNVSALLKGVNVPKSMLQSERVHEIIPTGVESCIYRTWEFQKGHAAKSNKKKNGAFLQKMFETWCYGIREFSEGLHAPKIDRRDFSISEEVETVISN